MARVVYLPAAREDLFGIWQFIAAGSGSPDIADNFIDIPAVFRRPRVEPGS